jgi:hypothetical protein
MSVRLGNVTILVRDYDEALKFYTEVLGFEKRSDEKFGPGARWVTVGSPGQGVQIILQKPEPAMQGEENARLGCSPLMIVARLTNCTIPAALSSANGPRKCPGARRRFSKIYTASIGRNECADEVGVGRALLNSAHSGETFAISIPAIINYAVATVFLRHPE